MSVNDVPRTISEDSRGTLQIVASLTDDSRGVIYDINIFIIQFNVLVKKYDKFVFCRCHDFISGNNVANCSCLKLQKNI